jgi:hypothetical protein
MRKLPFEGELPDFSRSVSAIAAKDPNSRRPGPLGLYIPWSEPASIFSTRAAGPLPPTVLDLASGKGPPVCEKRIFLSC